MAGRSRPRAGRLPVRVAVFIVAAVFVATGASRADDWRLDPTFGTRGFVTTQLGTTASDFPSAVAIQADGKIVVAGTEDLSDTVAMVRYLPDGSLDPSFGISGKVVMSPASASINALAVLADGKLIGAGGVYDSTTREAFFALLRFNPDGAIDGTFGQSGIARAAFGPYPSGARALAIQPDGKLVLAGLSARPDVKDRYQFALARFESDGRVDSTFGAAGTVTTAVALDSFANGVLVDPDGKILVAGSTDHSYSLGFAVVRYDPDGALDQTFGTNGQVRTSVGDTGGVSAMARQSDGRIVLVGETTIPGSGALALARYQEDGTLDDSFGTGGTVITPLGGEVRAGGAAVLPDGTVLVAGDVGPFGRISADLVLAPYRPDGTLPDGALTRTDLGGDERASALAVQEDGKIVVAGFFANALTGRFGVARYVLGCTTDGDCPACEACNAEHRCRLHARTACRGSTRRGASHLVIQHAEQDELTWAWRKGTATALAAFGNPLATDDYTLCVFNDAMPLLRAQVRAGGACDGGKPCWTTTRTGFRYAAEKSRVGVVRLRLAAGKKGKANVAVNVQGSMHVPLTALPLGVPVTVQLQGAGQCWGARFSAKGVLRNRPSRFDGRSD